MSASSRMSASVTVAGENRRVRPRFHVRELGHPVCLCAFRGGCPRADQISDHTHDKHERIDAGTADGKTERPIERVEAGIGDAVDRGDCTKGEREFDPALGVPETFDPMRPRDGHAHLDREGGRDDRHEEAERERDAAGELGECRDPGPEDRWSHAHPRDALGPSGEPRPAPHAEDLLRSVCRDDEANDGTNKRDCEIGRYDRCDEHGDASFSSVPTTPSTPRLFRLSVSLPARIVRACALTTSSSRSVTSSVRTPSTETCSALMSSRSTGESPTESVVSSSTCTVQACDQRWSRVFRWPPVTATSVSSGTARSRERSRTSKPMAFALRPGP